MATSRSDLLLVTGVPGVGKTTALRRAAAELAPLRPGGFYTEESRQRGARVGFHLVPWDPEASRRLLAHVDRAGPPRVGRYGVDVAAVDAIAATSLAPGRAELYIVDEIGAMECLSAVFVAAVRALVASGTPLVASVAVRGGGLIEEIKRVPAAETIGITTATRDAAPAQITAWVRSLALPRW